ncbi:hypothetical protein X798_02458 [Onchocerca flexuosa]|uniref:Transketolase C-terminal domain-containing protein n=1 Tax=Onchocerca flexuosa TaxID=387005 RepID=A0A238C018_9BILA|nr:hypothetical protein X798_02458 [Onchocerca flexuosa]
MLTEHLLLELINLLTLRLLDTECIKNSVKEMRRLITVDAGWPFCSIGVQISWHMCDLSSYNVSNLFPFGRYLRSTSSTYNRFSIPVPYSEVAETQSMPESDHIKILSKF